MAGSSPSPADNRHAHRSRHAQARAPSLAAPHAPHARTRGGTHPACPRPQACPLWHRTAGSAAPPGSPTRAPPCRAPRSGPRSRSPSAPAPGPGGTARPTHEQRRSWRVCGAGCRQSRAPIGSGCTWPTPPGRCQWSGGWGAAAWAPPWRGGGCVRIHFCDTQDCPKQQDNLECGIGRHSASTAAAAAVMSPHPPPRP